MGPGDLVTVELSLSKRYHGRFGLVLREGKRGCWKVLVVRFPNGEIQTFEPRSLRILRSPEG